jgi:hypothetical protein
MYYSDFKCATNPESVRRSRQLVQADHPELEASETVKNLRHKKELEKGTFAYRSKIGVSYTFDPITQTYK